MIHNILLLLLLLLSLLTQTSYKECVLSINVPEFACVLSKNISEFQMVNYIMIYMSCYICVRFVLICMSH